MKTRETNILVVGSGVAGGVMAEGLLKKSKGPVMMLEAGSAIPMKDRRIWLDLVMTRDKKRIPYTKLTDNSSEFETDGKSNIPWNLEGGRLIVRGGSTMHWGGWSPRMKPEDFELHSRIGMGGLDWPFSYNDLEPYYIQAEKYLQVAGDSKDLNPPRSGPYPYEAPPFTLTDNFIISGLSALGISYGHIPIARNAKPINGKPACVTTGTCDYCPIEARFTGNQPLDRLEKKYSENDFELITNAVAKEVIVDKKNHAVGVNYLDTSTNEIIRVNAEKIILCAGSLEIPKLLLASTSKYWNEGIGNDTVNVGRYIVANPFFYMRGLSKTNSKRLQEELFIPTIGSRHWDTPEHQKEGKFFLNKSATPDIKLASLMNNNLSINEIEKATLGEQKFELQGTVQTFSFYENRVKLAPGTTRFGMPRTYIEAPIPAIKEQLKETIFTRFRNILTILGYDIIPDGFGIYNQRGDHAMCTTRMSNSPATGVVDSYCKVHDMDNLYIISNSVFPSGAAANPTLTLVALALKTLDAMTAN